MAVLWVAVHRQQGVCDIFTLNTTELPVAGATLRVYGRIPPKRSVILFGELRHSRFNIPPGGAFLYGFSSGGSAPLTGYL